MGEDEVTRVLYLYDIAEKYTNQLRQKGIDVEVVDTDPKGDVSKNPEAMKALQGKGVVVVRSQKVTRDLMDNSNLTAIIRAGAGVDNIDVDYATQKGVVVENTPGMNSQSVAEILFHHLSDHVYDLNSADNEMRGEEENVFPKGKYRHTEFFGKTIGIIGFGHIGQHVSDIARGYHMKIISYDPFVSDSVMEDKEAISASLEDIFLKSDFITLHTKLTDETKGFINYGLLRRMKENAILGNTAREGLIVFDDLVRVLKEKPGLRYATDVFQQEGIGNDIKILRELFGKRVSFSPHDGANSEESQERVSQSTVKQIIAFSKGEFLNCVNYREIPKGLDKNYLILIQRLGTILGHIAKQHGKLERVEMTCYSNLKQFEDILLDYGLAGIENCYSEEIATPIGITDRFKEYGIGYELREPRYDKYGDSITFDVFSDGFKMSIRGRLDEDGQPIIRRIDEANLRVVPEGNLAIFVYEKANGALESLAGAARKAGLSIRGTSQEDPPEDHPAVCVFRLDNPYPPETIEDFLKNGLKLEESDRVLKVYTATTVSF